MYGFSKGKIPLPDLTSLTEVLILHLLINFSNLLPSPKDANRANLLYRRSLIIHKGKKKIKTSPKLEFLRIATSRSRKQKHRRNMLLNWYVNPLDKYLSTCLYASSY